MRLLSTSLYGCAVTTVGCAACGTPIMDEKVLERSRWRLGADLCLGCYQTSIRDGKISRVRYCTKCSGTLNSTGGCPRCMVVDRVGAEMFECDCGAVVHMADSVRMLRRNTTQIERVCGACSRNSPCRSSEHVIVTPQRDGWREADYPFQPYPDGFKPGLCTICRTPLHWDGRRWARMSWGLLAELWERTDA